jgi:hypothetical protein
MMHSKKRRTMKGGETTLERVTRTPLDDIATEIDELYKQVRIDGETLLRLQNELETCKTHLKEKSDALKRAALRLNQAEYLI